MTNLNRRPYGVLAVGEAAVAEGQSLYWDAAGDLVTSGVTDDYRWAGFCKNLNGQVTSDAGDSVAVIDSERSPAIADGANDYIPGDLVVLGAAGIVVQEAVGGVDQRYVHNVTGGEAGAGAFTLQAYCGSPIAVTNVTLGIEYIITDQGVAPALGEVSYNVTTKLLTFNAAEIIAADVMNITYSRIKGPIARVVTGCIAPATAIAVNPL